MAISNNSTGLRPGVCLSTTRPTAPYEGQMIYETDTDKTLFWNGSAWVNINSVSPDFTGTPTASTAAAGTNNTQLATTEFVRSLIQYQGSELTVTTAGVTVTFTSGRFTATPIVALAPSYVTASGAGPSGFAFIPYLGRPTTTSVVLASTAGTIQVQYIAIATNI